ncbi:MAG: glycosyltransferase [Candidatus Omnitrophota bacterium]|nr:glycosyltransferase [Candidatus Omnitrophota bacterium]
MPKKILITYASAGAGHKRAAEAAAGALRKKYKDVKIELWDILDYSSFLFQKTYSAIYLFAITYMPLIWGMVYLVLDNPVIYFIISPLRRLINKLNSRRFVQFLGQLDPDVVISTHFYSSEVIAHQRRNNRYRGRLISVITDFRTHSFWLARGIDKFVVAVQSTKKELIKKGIDQNKIEVLGIPIGHAFGEPKNKDLLLEKLGLQKGLFTILVVSGGLGVGPIEELVAELEGLSRPAQLIIVCGNNKPLYQKLSNKQLKIPGKVYGFSRNMHELMAVSDVIVGKSGGLTSSECLASNSPLIIVAPVPGQETRNCDVLAGEKAVLKIKKAGEIRGLVIELLDNPQELDRIKENIRRIAKPNSALDLAGLAIGMKD